MNLPITRVPFVDLVGQHQLLSKEITAAIDQVISRGDFVLGSALEEFETAFAHSCGVDYAVGVASGTDAIALGLKASGIGRGDEVIVPANTFIATIIGILETGATPILVDCDAQTALIDLKAANKVVTNKTKAIVPVHLYGQMVSPSELLDFAQSHDLLIFEDAAQAHLAQREGYLAGTIGIAGAFSFYPSKNLGAFGNGGMLITKSEAIATGVKTLRNYGAKEKYYHSEIGKNSRLDTIQAAILGVKLPYLSGWNQSRYQLAQLYDQYLQSLPLIQPLQNHCNHGHVYHLYVITCAAKRNELQHYLTSQGIQTGIHYPIPCHLQPGYQHLGYSYGDFPVTEALAEKILSLPMYPNLTDSQVELVGDRLVDFINKHGS